MNLVIENDMRNLETLQCELANSQFNFFNIEFSYIAIKNVDKENAAEILRALRLARNIGSETPYSYRAV